MKIIFISKIARYLKPPSKSMSKRGMIRSASVSRRLRLRSGAWPIATPPGNLVEPWQNVLAMMDIDYRGWISE
jgi:hypothetical protein